MHPRHYAASHGDKPALIMAGTKDFMTYGELESICNQGAHLFRKLGIKAGDIISVWARNSIEFMSLFWTAQRCGVYINPLPVYLSVEDAAYILKDCGAKLLIISSEIRSAKAFASQQKTILPETEHIFSLHGNVGDFSQWEVAISNQPSHPISDESAGWHLIYSSGTTGRPKGVKLPLIGGAVDENNMWVQRYEDIYGLTERSVFLACAPLYHTAPLLFASNVMRRGATVVIMKKFDATKTLQAIETHKVTLSQMVPTMFIRMLALPDSERLSFDVSSLKHVIHAAAPCPVEVKYKMLDWFGDIIDEYYAGSESIGATIINAKEWRERPGSVGHCRTGALHICDDEGNELPIGEIGNIYFEGGYDFEYLNDPEKTRNARNPIHSSWATLGDVGYVDTEGYLYLTDRKNFVIISGGVNIYPQEAENILVQHPDVYDAAVFGIPNEDMGEEVKAVVQPKDWLMVGADFEDALITFCRKNLTTYKCPKSIDFEKNLPRQDNGKLYKKALKARYWENNR